MKRTRLKVCDCSVIKILICACMRMMEGRSNVSNVSKTGCLVYSKYDYHYTYCNILSLSNYVATSTARDRETVTGVRPPFRVCFFLPPVELRARSIHPRCLEIRQRSFHRYRSQKELHSCVPNFFEQG